MNSPPKEMFCICKILNWKIKYCAT
uniref:Uncharacterized protein n=1 Tax=Anguilla anguilla TaxID=7936 RepID=A0A0E9PM00_ANGAN